MRTVYLVGMMEKWVDRKYFSSLLNVFGWEDGKWNDGKSDLNKFTTYLYYILGEDRKDYN